MYHQIYKMNREGFSNLKISQELGIDRRTVKFYLTMDESQYDKFIQSQAERKRELAPYEEFVKSRLERFQETPSAQMHDWLMEHYPIFPRVTSKTVYNFVMWVRQKYHLPQTSPIREYNAVEELEYGLQAQVDFGEYNMRNGLGQRIKVRFFAMTLSRSRYKYVFFSDVPFTSHTAILAHEKAFAFFGGIPKEIVYDQDKVFLSDENKGDLLLTSEFKDYCRDRPFRLHFCRKADPESKGKIENVVKYVKHNFLYNRPFTDVDLLNSEALAWLGRTANVKPHAGTQKAPLSEWVIEMASLTPFTATVIATPSKLYMVRKDNIISWKGCFYMVPSGTYKGRGTQAKVVQDNGSLVISSLQDIHICTHPISNEKGKLVSNTDLRRQKSDKIDKMITDISLLFESPVLALQYMENIRREKPRYIRDQLSVLKQTTQTADNLVINEALQYCINMNVFSANDFKSVVTSLLQKNTQMEILDSNPVLMNPLNGNRSTQADCYPMKSSINDYELLMAGGK
jgi:transposase